MMKPPKTKSTFCLAPPPKKTAAWPDAAWLPPHPVPGGASAGAPGALPARAMVISNWFLKRGEARYPQRNGWFMMVYDGS